MDVTTPDAVHLSPGAAAVYVALAGLTLLALLVPALRFEAVAAAIRAFVMLSLFALSGRALVSALLSLADPTPPESPDDDLPTVSVVITAYNEAGVLPDTLSACRELDYPADKLEIVVCYEAASTDATGAIAEAAAAAATDPPVTAVERDWPPSGKAGATNVGIERASGDVVAVIDADQRFEPDAVRRAVSWFGADEDVWCVKGRCYGVNPAASLTALHATVERHLAERAEFYARDVFGGFTLFTGGQAFFRASALRALGPFDETVLLEDLDMACRVHAAGGEIRVDPGVVTRERNPTDPAAWWHQRARWARGGMQVARRHLARLVGDSSIPLRVRLDVGYTFGVVLAIALVALAAPVALVAGSAPYPRPFARVLWGFLTLSPFVVSALVFGRDLLSGREHAPREYLVPFTLGAYLAVQGAVFVVAFLDEFVLDREPVYVTSTRADAD